MKKKTNKKNTAMPTSRAKTAYDLLSDISRIIVAEPKRYNQRITLARRSDRGSSRRYAFRENDYPACGTIGCVAGWVVALKRPRTREAITVAAERVLGLDGTQGCQLFTAAAAPGSTQTAAHAQRGAAHIARFQEKYAAQLKATKV